ncbi:hypothetical protein FSP39_020890 [Pinctada imbricata]|uniref:C2H2-type domain-containing protein n=1 Tax=Pinctada imbricata TaxID=66713 RepID=A0AA89BXS5_PINIB|nr:hypothetical protein FSP39_020890 [Pinctada imbricata]
MEVRLLSQQEEKFALFVENILRHGKELSTNDLGDLQQEAAHSNHGDNQHESTNNHGNIDQNVHGNYANSQQDVLFSNLGVKEEVTEHHHGNKQLEGINTAIDLSKKTLDERHIIKDNQNDSDKGGSNINVKEALFKKLCKDREKKYSLSSQCYISDGRNQRPQEPILDHSYISMSKRYNDVKVDLKELKNFVVEDHHNLSNGKRKHDQDMSEDSKNAVQNTDDTSHDSLQKMDDTSQDSVQKMEESSLDYEQGDDGSMDTIQDSEQLESKVKRNAAETVDLQSMTQQMKKKKGQMHYKCNICGYGTNSYKLHKRHKNTHKEPQHITRAVTQSNRKEENVKKTPVVEKKKKKTTSTRYCRKIKPEVAVPEKKLRCDKCQFRTDSEEKLKRHMTVHQSPDSFVCGICNFKCRTKTGLGRHLKKHREEMPWICQICHYQAHDEFSLNLHMKSHSTGEMDDSNANKKIPQVPKKQRFKCDVCDFSTTNEEAFQKHWGKHTGEKYYKCDECIFGTNNKSVYLSHQRLHLGAKPYQCQTCGSRFTQMRGLKTHQNSNLCTPASGQKAVNQTVKITKNTAKVVEWAKAMISKKEVSTSSGDTKPGIYKCNQCEFSTNRPSHLSRHIIIHLDAKPFKCELCDYSANFKINLTTHMRVHSGEKPNKCELCPYSTYREDHLRRHLATHRELTSAKYQTVSENELKKEIKEEEEMDSEMDDIDDMEEACDESEEEDDSM